MPSLNLEELGSLDGDNLLSALEQAAVSQKISDIHINPKQENVCVQWRDLGILRTVLSIPREKFVTIQRRIKFKAKLKLNIETAAQDGQYTFAFDARTVNVRVATLPTRFGEAFTLRFLDPERGIVPLEALGFPDDIRSKLHALVQLPNGLILVTGPTGSGKTTTLYALLSTVAGKDRNIVTLEDPIEYELKDIIQTQVDAEHGYTFASGLRAILRHDPDIILVGEIRDQETAQTAIDASLTGHLVLATLHTNSAIEAIPRLLSMGASSYTFAPALRGVLAQRLVRTVKPELRTTGHALDDSDPQVYGGQCVIPELLIGSPAVRSLILTQATSAEILAAAKTEGYRTMTDWGEELIHAGTTTRGEVTRVTNE